MYVTVFLSFATYVCMSLFFVFCYVCMYVTVFLSFATYVCMSLFSCLFCYVCMYVTVAYTNPKQTSLGKSADMDLKDKEAGNHYL